MSRPAGLVAALALALLVTALAAWLFQRRLIYLPLEQRVFPASTVLPSAVEVRFDTADGLTLQGWFVPAGHDRSGATVLVFNGNAGNRSYRAPLAAALARAGLSVLLFDYRGFGGNPGRPSEAGLLEDARAARGFLERHPDVDPQGIVLFGESLGAAVAVASAAERAPAALVLRSPFTSMGDVGRLHYPFLPVGLLLRDRYPSIDRIAGIECPLLVLAGTADRIVPVSQSRDLHAAAGSADKRLVILEGADHNDLALLAGDRLIREVTEFVRQSVGRSDPIR